MMADPLTLHFGPAPRRYRIGPDSGEAFAEGEDFDGFTLMIEMTGGALEAAAFARAMRALVPHWIPSDDWEEEPLS